ncbi:aldose 1-epimerase [Astrocystis sublimbata]|nr:aldose 1-epimerase [Astrocystis sublimbata]
MRFSSIFQFLAITSCAWADVPKPGADGKYTINSANIKAQFIEYGATLTNLLVKDKNGEEVDVVLGYDDLAFYPKDPGHPVYNSVPGRYVNRIGHGKYNIDNKTYSTELNDGTNTLHSGTNNWSYRTWNVTTVTNNSITFAVRDEPNSSKGMPGLVLANVTYTVEGDEWEIKMDAVSPEVKSPLMLTHHTYFNLDAYRNPDTNKIWNHTLYMPHSKGYLVADDGALPTGEVATAEPGSIHDFSSKPDMFVGHARNLTGFSGNCGGGGACEGYNTYFPIEPVSCDEIVVTLASPFSGIKADLRTDQAGVVIYTCNWFDGTADLKSTQGTSDRKKVERSSCIAIEAQDWVDGINHPEWRGRRESQIVGPGQMYSWRSSWTFSTL